MAALGLLVRVCRFALGWQPGVWQRVVIFVALLSIVIGALGAIGQDNIKRLLAYSSINNVGFMLIGLACANQVGAAAMLVYLATYVAMPVAGFVGVLSPCGANGRPGQPISAMAGPRIAPSAVPDAPVAAVVRRSATPPGGGASLSHWKRT